MTPNPDPSPPSTSNSPRGWAWLALALAWTCATRVPLVLNARDHLDSDLAVDGLTLIDALNGHWRWHYPGTPFIGTPPVLLSWIQAKALGPTPMALVSGGVVAYALIVGATFLLNRRAFGPSVAAWGLVPLAFASTGAVWLSGRVTGGHLLAAAWHAGAFLLLWDALAKGGWWRSAILGLWCGFGLYIDTMFAMTWVGLGVAACVFASLFRGGPTTRPLTSLAGESASPLPKGEGGKRVVPRERSLAGRIARGFVCLLAFALASGVGMAPRIIGARVDPHDSYVGQFRPVGRLDVVAKNARILALDCLPRLIAGHRLPGLEAEPDPSGLSAGSPSSPEKGLPWLGLSVTIASLGLFARATAALFLGGRDGAGGGGRVESARAGPARVAIRCGLAASSLAVAAGFLAYPSITNSDNYRYLVFWLVPWSSGFGLMMARFASRWPRGHLGAGALALGFAALMTVDSVRWYERFGWVDSNYLPARKSVAEPVLDWLDDHLRVTAIYGDYWDVYRLSFLAGGRYPVALPFPEYPDRFPEMKRALPRARYRVILIRPDGPGPSYRARALALGAQEVGRGEGFSIVRWPQGLWP